MTLELNIEELQVLRELVTQSVRELGPEIHHTDSRQYRDALEQRRQLLEGLAERLEDVVTARTA